MILYMLVLFPVVAGMIAIGVMMLYRIDTASFNRILEQIRERREADRE